jgi:hypothetical protein
VTHFRTQLAKVYPACSSLSQPILRLVRMRAGADRTNVEYAWPPTLVRPAGVRLVYLDLNHWIALAKAARGHTDGQRHVEALGALRAASSRGDVVLPLSASHYMEMSGIRNERHRVDVAAVMEELSGFATLLDRTIVMRLEIEAALDRIRPRPQPYAQVRLVGHGVGHAFGMVGGLRFRNRDGDDVTDDVRSEWKDGSEAFDKLMTDAECRLDRSSLRGPSQEEEPELRAVGWDPTVARRMAQRRAAGERELAGRLEAEPRWRRGRLRDVVSARYVAFEVLDIFNEALAARGLSADTFGTDTESFRRFVDSMPSADVHVTLLTESHRSTSTLWTTNDIFDLDALSTAVPYCDIVVTERRATHMLHRAGVPVRLSTRVVATLPELQELLA